MQLQDDYTNMANTSFVNQQTVIQAEWLNDVNNVTYVTMPGLNTTISALNTSKANAGANTDITSLSNVTVPTQANGTANGTIASTLFVSNSVANAPQPTQMQSVDYTLSGNALTLKLNPTTLAFRSTTLTNGAPTLVSTSVQITTTISSGSTGGTTSAVQSDIVLIAINNAGTMELAWTNLAGGTNLDETTLINTTAEGGAGAADSATVIYSTTARTGVAFRVVGIFRSTQTTAGTWAQSPTLVQGVGGQALTAMSSLGYGQTSQDVTGSRTSGTTYYNTTGRPIEVRTSLTSSGTNTLTRNGVTVGYNNAGAGALTTLSAIIPAGWSYSCTFTAALQFWTELR